MKKLLFGNSLMLPGIAIMLLAGFAMALSGFFEKS